MTSLKDLPTHALEDDMQMALYSDRKDKYVYHCLACNRKHSGVVYCEFCIATELYARRKTMAFMRMDLCVQTAVCLLAKTGKLKARPAGPKQERKVAFSLEHGAPYTTD